MIDIITEYYFSFKTLTFATVFFVISILGTLFIFFSLYEESLLYAILFASPLLVILIALPDYIWFMYLAIRKKPALILSKTSLINNTNEKEYKWSEIKEISYKQVRSSRGSIGVIAVVLNDSETIIRIPQNSIKCKTKKLLSDLQEYHKEYSSKSERTT